jgi:hypothetical protein
MLNKSDDKIRNIETDMSRASGARKWADHLLQVIIGFAVVVAIWFITKG